MKVNGKDNGTPPKSYKFYIKITIATILLSLAIATIFLLGVFLAKSISLFECSSKSNSDNQVIERTPSNGTLASETNDEHSLRLVPRDEWLAEPASERLDKLVSPVHRVIIFHTATENCTSQATCTYRARVLQDFHMKSRGFTDIAYNFLIGGDGCVYEGRGWDQVGAHTLGYNVDSIGIAFIGTFTTLTPPEKQLKAAELLIEEGIKLNKLVKDYRLYGARQLGSTESPGSALYAIIKKWSNWSPSL